ncbi:MAG TPA: DUF4386 domain-containing protein [Solirubrobacteraceae bacterium]|nr:DUF4386 domain-containing protein [Solirubrobacteraceae bacterium]
MESLSSSEIVAETESPTSALGPMPSDPRRIALIAGVLFLITFVTSIPAVLLYHGVLHNPGYVVHAGGNTRVLLGAFLELILIIANIGTAVVLFPILKRQSEAMSLAYVAARLVESAFISAGILCLLAVVTLRRDLAGGPAVPAALETAERTLVAIHNWTFLLGPGFVVGIGNGLLLGHLMYRSALVPRRMAMLGLVGGPLVCASGIAVLFDVIQPGSPWQAVATVPEFAWELSLGVYLAANGFRRSSWIITGEDRIGPVPGGLSPLAPPVRLRDDQ